MKGILLAVILAVAGSLAGKVAARDSLAEERVHALKKLTSLTPVYRLNEPDEVMPLRDLTDMVVVGLARNLPSLKINESADTAQAWLEVNLTTSDSGAVLMLVVHRWTTLRDTGEEVFAPVWFDLRAIFGHASRASVRESLEVLLTRLAADHVRANTLPSAR